MENSKIEWCDNTQNIWWGCTPVHEGCDNCYAEKIAHRYGFEVWGNDAPRREIASWEENLKKWQREAEAEGIVKRIFLNSMSDFFEKPMPLIKGKGTNQVTMPHKTDFLRNKFMKLVPQLKNLNFLILTKRPPNINKYIPEEWKTNPPSNVFFGCSVVNQETANKAIPELLKVNGNKFLSCEPLLGPVDLTPWLDKINWVIVGGESGHKKREFSPDWGRTIKGDCENAGVAFFMKQWDKVKEVPPDLMLRQFYNPIENLVETVASPQLIINENQTENMENNYNKSETETKIKGAFKQLIYADLMNGATPEDLTVKYAMQRNMPLKTAKAYVTMVKKHIPGMKTPFTTPKVKIIPMVKDDPSEATPAIMVRLDDVITLLRNASTGQINA